MKTGTQLYWICSHCNKEVPPTMNQCWHCGHSRDGSIKYGFPETNILQEKFEEKKGKKGLFTFLLLPLIVLINLVVVSQFTNYLEYLTGLLIFDVILLIILFKKRGEKR